MCRSSEWILNKQSEGSESLENEQQKMGRGETDREGETERGQGIQVTKVWRKADTRELKRRKRSDITKRSEYKEGGSNWCTTREGTAEGTSIPVTVFSLLKFRLLIHRENPPVLRLTFGIWRFIAGDSEIDLANILIWLKADYKFSFLKNILHNAYFTIISLSQGNDEAEMCLTFLCIQSTKLAWRYFHLSKGRLRNFVWYNLQSLSAGCGFLAFTQSGIAVFGVHSCCHCNWTITFFAIP